MLWKRIKYEIRNIDERYRDSMFYYFGFTDGTTHTKKEIKEKFGIDEETTKRLEKEIIDNVFKPIDLGEMLKMQKNDDDDNE